MIEFTHTLLWRCGLYVFVVYWYGGLGLRYIFGPAGMSSIDPVTMPAYRQIIMPGFLRWLFLYRPVRGGVSYPAFLLQLPAFFTLGITAALVVLFPSLHNAGWIQIVVLTGTGLLSIRFTEWLWARQQH